MRRIGRRVDGWGVRGCVQWGVRRAYEQACEGAFEGGGVPWGLRMGCARVAHGAFSSMPSRTKRQSHSAACFSA